MSLGAVSLNMFWNPAISGSNFLQASMQGIHTYATKLDKVNILGATKFPLLNRNLQQLDNHLGRIRSQTAKISANPIRLDIKTSRDSLKEARKDMTAIEHSAKQTAFYSRKNSENLKDSSAQGLLGTAKNSVKNKVKIGASVASAGVVGAIASLNPVRKAIDFESDMADVTKATNASNAQTLQLKNNILNQVNKGSLLNPSELAQIQAGGGRSGVAMENLPKFTSDIAKASVAMDLSTAESGKQFAKMAERLDLPIGKINIMTNAFTHLENNGANSAKDMINTTGRLSGVFKQLNFKPQNGAALSNYMNTLEVSPELAASSFEILTDRLKKTNSQFGYFDRLKNEGASGLKGIIKDITGRMNSEEIIKKFGSQGADVITKMSGDFKNLDKSLALVSGDGFMNAVENEYKIKVSTTGAQETMALNRITAQSIVIGDKLKIHYVAMLGTLSTATLSTISFYEANKELVNTVGGVVLKMTAVAIGIKAIKMISSPFYSLVSGAWKFRNQLKTGLIYGYKIALTALSFSAKVAGGAIKFMANSILWVGRALLLNPIGLALTAIAGAGYLIYSNWDYLKTQSSVLWNGITNSVTNAFTKVSIFLSDMGEGIKNTFIAMFNWSPLGLIINNWDKVGLYFSEVTTAIKSPFITLFDWIDEKFKTVMGVVDKVKDMASTVTNVGSDIKNKAKEKASNLWDGTKSFFGFGDDKKTKVLKAEPANNMNYKKVSKVEENFKKITNVENIKTEPHNSSLKEIPKLPIESVSAVTDKQMNEQKTQIATNPKHFTQNINNQITVQAVDGKIDYEDLKEKLKRAQKELAHDELDTQIRDVS